jgi:hypothetical protein
MSTGEAGRASVLTSACLVASGASPRHSAIADGHRPACSSKRTVRLINEVAPDPCRVRERYPGTLTIIQLPSKHRRRCIRPVCESARCTTVCDANISVWGIRLVGLGKSTPGEGSILGPPQGSQSSQRSGGFHKPAVSGAAPETATTLQLDWRSVVITAQACVGEVLRPPCVLRMSFCAGCKVSIALRAIVRPREFRANPISVPVASRTGETPVP